MENYDVHSIPKLNPTPPPTPKLNLQSMKQNPQVCNLSSKNPWKLFSLCLAKKVKKFEATVDLYWIPRPHVSSDYHTVADPATVFFWTSL